MYDVEKLVESNARMMISAIQKRREIRYSLEYENLGPLARQDMEKDLEKANYQVRIGAEFREAYRDYLRRQEKVKQPATPKVTDTIEARLVA